MSKRELLYGERKTTNFATAPSALAVDETGVVDLNDVEIFYSLFELPMAAALGHLPVSLHPSIPAVMATSFWRTATSPFGPFQLAYVGLACRTGIKPRHLVVDAWCDNPRASEFLRGRYGFDCRDAEVYCHESYDRVLGSVSIGQRTSLEIVATKFVPIVGGGGSVKYSAPLNLTSVGDKPVLAQFEAAYKFKRVQRGVVAAAIYDASVIGDADLAPTYPIAGTFAVCDVQLLPVRFLIDLEVPAEEGGASKVERKV